MPARDDRRRAGRRQVAARGRAARAGRRPARALRAAPASRTAKGSPSGPWRRSCAQLAGIRDEDSAEEARARVPQRIAQLIGLAEGSTTADQTAEAVAAFLAEAAADQPLVVFVDDIHWAEPALLDLLAGPAGPDRRGADDRPLPRAAGAARGAARLAGDGAARAARCRRGRCAARPAGRACVGAGADRPDRGRQPALRRGARGVGAGGRRSGRDADDAERAARRPPRPARGSGARRARARRGRGRGVSPGGDRRALRRSPRDRRCPASSASSRART